MENNQVPTVLNTPVQTAPPLQNPQPNPQVPEGEVLPQVTQTNTPILPDETKSIWKRYLRFNYLLGVLEVIYGISVFFGPRPIRLTLIVGAIISFAMAFASFKKPKLGYILFGISTLIFFLAYIAYRYTSP